jgi:hypothetical protein
MLSFATKVYSDCPPGYLSTVQIILVNGCQYSVHLCYKCPASPQETGEIEVFGFEKVDPNCNQTWDNNHVLQGIYDIVYSQAYLQSWCINIPPCNTGSYLWITFAYEKCWEKAYDNGHIYYEPCHLQDCMCYVLVRICYDEIHSTTITEVMNT